jgi:hypothetical protein
MSPPHESPGHGGEDTKSEQPGIESDQRSLQALHGRSTGPLLQLIACMQQQLYVALSHAACYMYIWLNFRDRASQIDPGAESARDLIEDPAVRTRDLSITYGGISRSGAGRRAAALRRRCAKCGDIALCPCYDGLSRRAPAKSTITCDAKRMVASHPKVFWTH